MRQLVVTLVLVLGLVAGTSAAYLLLLQPRSAVNDDSANPTPVQGVLVGAGDIARCTDDGDEVTAALLDEVVAAHPEAVVFTTGDHAYPDGTYQEFLDCYDPSWGRHKDRTRPAVGNHDFGTTKAADYHRYWGDRAGEFDHYYYSYDVGDWHVVVLSAECHRVGCELDSQDGDQAEWLQGDLEASDAQCTIAIWHDPRWSSGRYGNNADLGTFWELLYDHDAEIVLNGHEHFYERFEPMNPDGRVDEARGIRQFIVGTGGGELREFEEIQPTSAARGGDYGVLKLTLEDGRYSWEFLPAEGGAFVDSGTGTCH